MQNEANSLSNRGLSPLFEKGDGDMHCVKQVYILCLFFYKTIVEKNAFPARTLPDSVILCVIERLTRNAV